MGQLSLARYEIRRVLGSGGTGTVYEAFDHQTAALVALKAVEASVAESVFRLKHEFRVLSDVQHQNLVHFGELACENGQWFFTMELIAGSSFIDYVRPAPREDTPPADADAITRTVLDAWHAEGTPPGEARPGEGRTRGGPSCDVPRLRAALSQLVDALSTLHRAGRVHRDVKPGNVLVTREGRVVLLDFGLVAELAARGGELDASGTPAYMAPEQIQGGQISRATDWYALGTMIYLALTGRLPHPGSWPAVMASKLAGRPRPPSQLVPDLPDDLERLCLQLLEIDPEQRPDEHDLRACLGMPARPAATAGESASRFVGRAAERRVLDQALAEVRGGRPRALVVEGEPGVGKTALVSRFLAEVRPRPRLLAGRCYEEERVPFKGADSIVDALSVYLLRCPEDELGRLLAGGVRYLATVFPVLARVPEIAAAVASGRSVVSEVGLRESALGELGRLLAALAHRRPLVVFLDDLQWAGEDSVALLERTVLPASENPCLFVATLRSGVEITPAVERLCAASQRLALTGLAEAEARELWDDLRGAASPAERDAAMREAAGHPLFLTELARAGSGDWRAGTALLDVLHQRIGQREASEQRFLEMAAVAGAPTPYQIIARAAGLDAGECLTHLGSLKATQLLQVDLVDEERCVLPYHDRVREALLGRLAGAPGGLAPLQLRLGRALLAATSPAGLPARVFTIVRHLNAAAGLLEPDERRRVAELDLLASREARLATAYAQARELAGQGLQLVAGAGWQGAYELHRDLHLARMEAEAKAGEREAARRTFEVCRRHLRSDVDSARLWSAWVVAEAGTGRFVEAIAAGREALRELGRPIPERISKATIVREYLANRWAQRRAPVNQLASLPPLDDPHLEAALDVLVAIGAPAFFVDTDLMVWLNLRIAGEAMRKGVSGASPFGFAGYGMALAAAFGEYEQAATVGQASLTLDRRLGNVALSAKVVLVNGSFITWRVRRLAESIAQLRQAYELSVQHGDPSYEVYASCILSVVSFCESAELGALQRTCEWAREVGLRRGDRDMAGTPDIFARHAAALREPGRPLDLGRPGSSDAELRASLSPESTPVAYLYYHFCNADLAVLDGRWQRADQLLHEAAAHRKVIFGLPATIELAFLEGLVAARLHDGASRLERVRLLARLLVRVRSVDVEARSCPDNFEAHALILHAELARIRGRHAQAAALYERAALAARRHLSPRREAIALELASTQATTRGAADELRARAADAFRRWGALHRAEALGG